MPGGGHRGGKTGETAAADHNIVRFNKGFHEVKKTWTGEGCP
jgi:hypothetical protein